MATTPDQKLSTTTAEFAPDRPVASDTGATEEPPLKGSSRSRGGSRVGRSGPPRLLGLRDLDAWVEEKATYLAAPEPVSPSTSPRSPSVNRPPDEHLVALKPDVRRPGEREPEQWERRELGGNGLWLGLGLASPHQPERCDDYRRRDPSCKRLTGTSHGITDVDGSWVPAADLLGHTNHGRARTTGSAESLGDDLAEFLTAEDYYHVPPPDPTGAPPGRPAKLVSDPAEIERLFRVVWAAAWHACERYRPGDSELKKVMWTFLTLNVLVHGNLNMRALEKAPVTSKRSRSHWERLRKRHSPTLEVMNELVRRLRRLEATGWLISSDEETALSSR
jgi:hypothetical protein